MDESLSNKSDAGDAGETESTERQAKCWRCKEPFTQTVNRFAGRSIPLSHICPACIAEEKARRGTQIQSAMRRRWAAVVGDNLAATNINHPGIAAWVIEAATHWTQRPLEHFGLIGPSGIGKTRIMALVGISRAIMAGRSAMLLPAADLRDLSAMSHDARAAAEALLAEAMIAGVLFIDDIGKEGDGSRVSSATAAGMWRIVDQRYRSGKPLLWTANGSPADIAAAYPPEFAEKLRRRLLEMGPHDRHGHLPQS